MWAYAFCALAVIVVGIAVGFVWAVFTLVSTAYRGGEDWELIHGRLLRVNESGKERRAARRLLEFMDRLGTKER
jgi:hypothetical protein